MLLRLFELAMLASVVFAVPQNGLELRDTVEAYLESGKHGPYQRHLNLPKEIVYNPVAHLHVDKPRVKRAIHLSLTFYV